MQRRAQKGVGGSFSPQVSPVLFSSMLPHVTVNLFFGVVLAAALITAAIGASRAWRAFTSEKLRTTSFRRVSRSFASVLREIATHEHFSECQQFPWSRWAHGLVLYGFLTLFVLAALTAVLIATGNRYPFPVLHPLKIVGNVAAVLVIAGSWYFLAQRVRTSRSGQASSWFDWALPVQLLLISVTGVLAEIFRYTNVAEAAYPTYFLHLVLVFILFASAPTSKLAHVFYRTVALTAEHYNATSRMKVPGLYARKLTA